MEAHRPPSHHIHHTQAVSPSQTLAEHSKRGKLCLMGSGDHGQEFACFAVCPKQGTLPFCIPCSAPL